MKLLYQENTIMEQLEIIKDLLKCFLIMFEISENEKENIKI